MECFVCKRKMPEVGRLVRVNEKGVEGIWACVEHRKNSNWKPIPEVEELCDVIQGKR